MAVLKPITPVWRRRLPGSCHALWLAACALCFLPTPGMSEQLKPVESREYQIKAVFLFNFAQFVAWPPASFADARAPIVIGVLGDDPFGHYLDEAVHGEVVNRRALVVQRYRRIEEIQTCHILFISRSESDAIGGILHHLKSRSILTVGDTEGFALNGGVIRFVNENNKVRLRINLEAAKAANLTLSSKLLRPAEIVATRKE